MPPWPLSESATSWRIHINFDNVSCFQKTSAVAGLIYLVGRIAFAQGYYTGSAYFI